MKAEATLFCFGLGYSAGFLARAVSAQGWQALGTSRDPGAGEAEFPLHRLDRAHPLAEADKLLGAATHVLVSIPPDETGCPVCDLYGPTLVGLKKNIAWLGYLSSTNVYGDRGGAWVDESSPTRPSSTRGQRRVAAEEAWLDLQRGAGLPVHIFRLAAIYGPGRSALDAVKAGTARRIAKPGQVFSRIAVEDLTAVLLASMARPRPGAIYNVCDDEPASPEAVVAYAAALIGLPPPPLEDFASAALSPMARSFYDDNKRVANRLIRDELGVKLRYPTYREGLAALNRAKA